jgi:hypothetical protein
MPLSIINHEPSSADCAIQGDNDKLRRAVSIREAGSARSMVPSYCQIITLPRTRSMSPDGVLER